MAADIDVRVLSSFASTSEAAVVSLVENPTAELVKAFLHSIGTKVKECEQIKAQKVRLEVELETHVRTSESNAKVLQQSRDKALADVSKLRTDLQNAENLRARVESDLEGVRQSKSQEASETANLKARVSSLEASNRDALALLESKSSSYDRLSQELTAEHQKVVDLRRQVSLLEQENQTARSAESSLKFKNQSLDQEIELQKKNNEWLENERKIKSEEHSSYRKEKNARVSELQRLNEQYIDEAESLRRSEAALKSRLDEQIAKNEQLLQDIQKLREKEINDAENHRIELDSVTRLAELQKASADTTKQRVQELTATLDEVREDAADEIGRIRAEIQTEHNDREAAEQRVSELENQIAEFEAELQQARIQHQPTTPRRETNGSHFSTPVRPGTPLGSFTPRSAGRVKGNMSVTQLYAEYTKLERELAKERRSNEQLQAHVDSMLEDLEANKPEIEELRSDQNRLQSEVFEMSALAEQANLQRDATAKDLRILHGQMDATRKELEDSQQALRDRNSQLRHLILEQQGVSMSEAEYRELEQAALQADQRETEHLSGTQQDVNRHLVAFRNITDLQSTNEKQLITIRNLVANLESEQAKERQQQFQKLEQELDAARSQITSFQDEIKSMVAQSKSFATERDMFRNMLTRRGQLPTQVDPADFSRSMPLPAGVPPSNSERGDHDYAKLLKDLQTHFDTYRQETSTDAGALKKQVSELSQRNSQLQAEASRVMGQVTAANQRYEMLQSNFNMMKSENAEIQKRSYTAMETATKQELKTQQVAEELVETKGMLDSLRRESANLKAEKNLWKSVEKRLVDDIESLRNERGRLDQLNASLQNILNERETSDAETRRRLQSQVESLDGELQVAKRKLGEEIEESKKLSLRREYEHDQSQKRIDDLMANQSSLREELASVKTARDHLQARLDEMTVELRSAEERLELLAKPAEATDESHDAENASASVEQDLRAEISELKRDLEVKTSELDAANEQIEVYKEISQQAEERLQEIAETNDQYKAETENQLDESATKVKDLERRIEDITSELSTTNSELSQLRDEQAESTRKLEAQKSSYEQEIVRLKETEERALEQATFNLEASKIQAQIATEAHQNYENELLKHAEAAKSLHVARADANNLKLEVAEYRTQAETLKSDLESKEGSWSEIEERLKREVEDVKVRREEVVHQNSILHTQLEQLTQQVSALQRDRTALAETAGTQSLENASSEAGSMQEVINYLRREKEIVDVQYHLSTQEARRLRQQLESSQSQLDEVRLKLDQQRRAETDLERNAMNHNKLMETLNELNLYRESSVTLRSEAKQAREALSAKSERIEELEAQIGPLQARIAELENLAELREGEMKLLQDDRDHWQQRTQNILSKYDRVDPAELESLKSKISELETERDTAVAERDSAVTVRAELQTQVDAHPVAIEAAKSELRGKLGEQFKARSREMSGKVREKQAEINTITAEKDELRTELDAVKEQLEIAKAQAAESNNVSTPQPATSTQETTEDSQERNVSELESKISELEAALAAEKEATSSKVDGDGETAEAREARVRTELNQRLETFKAEAEAAKQTALDELREVLKTEHQKEIEALRAQSVPVSSELPRQSNGESSEKSTSADNTNDFDHFVNNLTEAQAKLVVQKNDTIKNILRANIRKQVEKEKESLRHELANKQGETGDQTSPAQTKELEEKFAAEKEAILKQKDEELATEKAKLVEQHHEDLEKERRQLLGQHRQELEGRLAESAKNAEQKTADQVARAEAMAEKKGQLKVNMAQNQARVAGAKLEVVKKAAEETPEKAVKEVWDIAKDTKPAAQPKPGVPVNTAQTAAPAPAPAPSTAPPIPTPAPSTAAHNQPSTATVGTDVKNEPNPQLNGTDVNTNTVPPPGQGTSLSAETESIAGSIQPSPLPQQQLGTAPGSSIPRQQNTGIPQARGAFRGGRGGAAGQQGQQGQQHPQQQGAQMQATRGTGIPRGAGRGGPRGGGRGAGVGGPQVQTQMSQQQGQGQGHGTASAGRGVGSPSRGNLNPNAQQFTPVGNKRAREDSEGGSDGGGNMGKRIRGGGNAGGA